MPELTFDQALKIATDAHQKGQLQEAEHIYRQLLAFDPDHPVVLHLLGLIAHHAGQPAEGVRLIQAAIAQLAHVPEFHNNLGECLRALGRLEEAHTSYQRALSLRPDYADALTNLGLIAQARGQWPEAERFHARARALQPDSPLILNNLGSVLDHQQRRAEAQDLYRQALELDPHYLKPRLNLITSFIASGQAGPALAQAWEAVRLYPDSVEALLAQSSALKEDNKAQQAIPVLHRALELQPKNLSTLQQLAGCHHAVGDVDHAQEVYRQAIELYPQVLSIAQSYLISLNYSHGQDGSFMYEAHRKFVENFYGKVQPLTFTVQDRRPDKILRIGYCSNDFKNHSVSRFILRPMEAHDKTQLQIHCFTYHDREDAVTARYQQAADVWHKAEKLTDEQLAQRIIDHEIDILVDLGGYFGGRLKLHALQPAPLQISFLGYPNTTGLRAIDYRLTDAIADPLTSAEAFHAEKLWRLTDGAWCYRPIDAEVPITPLPALKFGHVTFGSFHGVHKFRPDLVQAWAQILARVPDSVLIIKSFKGLTQHESRERFRAAFETEGVSVNRIKYVPASLSETQHLELFSRIDLQLDTFPYNGTTITCEGLWMGVPSITLAGATHVCRVGASLMTHAGLPELVAENLTDYVGKAVGLAQDLPRLSRLRENLRPHLEAHPIGSPTLYARQLEAAYRAMWIDWLDQSSSGNQIFATSA